MPIATRSISALRPMGVGLRLLVVGLTALILGSCAFGGGGGLAPGLTARMDAPGASLDRAQALALINHFRASSGVAGLAGDTGLDAEAQDLAAQYSKTGIPPKAPADAAGIRFSAGYFDFAETFSGWRNSPADAKVLVATHASRAGMAAVYDANSPYGTYWVLLLGQ